MTFSNSVSYLAWMSSISREDNPNHAPSNPSFCQKEGGGSLTEIHDTCSKERAEDWCCPRLCALHAVQPTCTMQPSSPWVAMPCAGEPWCWPNSPVGWGKLLNAVPARARQRDHKLLWRSTSQRRHSCCPLTTTVMKSFQVACLTAWSCETETQEVLFSHGDRGVLIDMSTFIFSKRNRKIGSLASEASSLGIITMGKHFLNRIAMN